jgi:hypothetical protein
MNKGMEITEAKDAKKELEDTIRALLNRFVLETGLNINAISIEYGGIFPLIRYLRVEVQL